eukprot:12659749-Alexandrium_andersonii.AAC.1
MNSCGRGSSCYGLERNCLRSSADCFARRAHEQRRGALMVAKSSPRGGGPPGPCRLLSARRVGAVARCAQVLAR